MITVSEKPRPLAKKAERKAISLDTFKSRYLPKTTFKYEWKNGRVEKEEFAKAAERYMINNVTTKFSTSSVYQEGCRMMGEVDCYLSTVNADRRPDAAYLSPAQINFPETAAEAPVLVIEVSSPSHSGGQNIAKMPEYFKAGNQVVWYIYPDRRQVWVYTDPETVTICRKGDLCSADPAIPEFSVRVDEIFSSK